MESTPDEQPLAAPEPLLSCVSVDASWDITRTPTGFLHRLQLQFPDVEFMVVLDRSMTKGQVALALRAMAQKIEDHPGTGP